MRSSPKLPVQEQVGTVRRGGWGVKEALSLGFASFLFLQLLMALLLAVILDIFNVSDSIFDNTVFNFATYALISVVASGPVWLFLRRRRLGLGVIGLDKPEWRKYLWRVPLAFGVYYLASLAIYALVDMFVPGIDLEQAQDIGFEVTRHIGQLLLIFISLVIIPPLVEEAVFRGFLFRGLRSQLTFWPAALIASACFGLAHWQVNVALDTAALGVVSCWLFERTGSLWPSIALHALKNSVAFALIFIFSV